MMQQLLEYILAGGYVVMTLVVFVETGLLVGFFLPGDSLLFTAGLCCVEGNQVTGRLGLPHMDLLTLNLCLVPAAILGDSLGYWIGLKTGQRLYQREQTFLFRRDHLLYTRAFYEKHGGKTIFLARFVPLIRTFAPVVAGIGQMPYAKFLMWNVFGGFAWVTGLSVAGYYLGQYEWIKNNLEATILLIVFVSVLPVIIAAVKARFFDAPMAPATSGIVAE